MGSMKQKRIGIYSGSFNPVHAGHIAFAVQALATAKLDAIYFLPERRPRNKPDVEHFGHRVAMLRRATRPHRRLHVLELEDTSFTVATTLPRLKQRFGQAQLVFLFGSDSVQYMPQWPGSEQLLAQSELVVGVRTGAVLATVSDQIAQWSVQPQAVQVFDSHSPAVSSRHIREALRLRQRVPGLLLSVERYSRRNWLYVTVA